MAPPPLESGPLTAKVASTKPLSERKKNWTAVAASKLVSRLGVVKGVVNGPGEAVDMPTKVRLYSVKLTSEGMVAPEFGRSGVRAYS